MIIKMNAKDLRQSFLDFFKSKQHSIVPSAPLVVKNDPTLMFTNAGMNQFKDLFLGNSEPTSKRVVNSQKCLRVSGKHNDLEEVGHDTYHHTMFEMLGNWSFGDYFKEDAINWAWEFLTERLGLSPDLLYATYFEGSPAENVEKDSESEEMWLRKFRNAPNRVLPGSKKDNFWEMGDTGPCGPCSEIHIDLRDEAERKKIPGHELVNASHPLVVEIWNLVFIQYNRKSDSSLEQLPARHVDTGMGFERLCMAVQGKKSNYDTDLFQPVIKAIAEMAGKRYGDDKRSDIAMRVIADHLRAVSFSISDGQIPSNNRAGYVIRRILRRAIRYGYTNLGLEEPFIHKLVPVLADVMGDHFPELRKSESLITNVIHEEEISFLRTLGKGVKKLDKRIKEMSTGKSKVLSGKEAFELFDTYGFPLDLTQLILRESEMDVDVEGFEKEMSQQKERSREDAATDTGDWVTVGSDDNTIFTGYDLLEDKIKINRWRKIKTKSGWIYQLVFNRTPFYAESGGQIGDTGFIEAKGERTEITGTLKENNLIIHLASSLPSDTSSEFMAVVNRKPREATARNHTATHLLHHALRKVLGSHVEQKGSLVEPDRLRFDFSHFAKVTDDEKREIERIVNQEIAGNINNSTLDGVKMDEALNMGAMALFGEKYGDAVRVVKFGESVELCGGTHVRSTGEIGLFIITSEGAIAAGIRRIEALTGEKAVEYVNEKLLLIDQVSEKVRSTGNLLETVDKLISDNQILRKTVEKMQAQSAAILARQLLAEAEDISGIRFIGKTVDAETPETLKNIASIIRRDGDNLVFVAGASIDGTAHLVVMVSDNLVASKRASASDLIKSVSAEIKGGGGGQPFLASAGGKNPAGLQNAINKVRDIIKG